MGGRTQHTSDPAKMAACAVSYSEDFLLEDDFDAVLAIIDADILENDEDSLNKPKHPNRMSLLLKHQQFRASFATKFAFVKVE